MKRAIACYFVIGFVLAGCSNTTKADGELAVSTEQELNASKSQDLTLTQDANLKSISDEAQRQSETANGYYSSNNSAAIRAGTSATDLDGFIKNFFNVAGADFATAYYYN